MANIEEQIRQLEDELNVSEAALDQAVENNVNQETCFPYVYIIGGLIPLLTAAVLYCIKPKWIIKKGKNICWRSFLKWIMIITVIAWVGLYLINYCGAFSNAMACFSK